MNWFQRFVLWDYPRASVQYDLMVGLILVFVLLTPREWFKDQPKPSSVAMLPTARGNNAFWIDSGLLSSTPEAQKTTRAADLLRARLGHKASVVRLEPIVDSEQEVKGYIAFTTP
jgi:hypothetical protein